MKARNRIGALVGAATLVMAFTAVASAGIGGPTYGIDLTKSADPETVPAGGGDVTYTITVTGTGTGDLQLVNIDDDMAGCTLAGPTGDNGGGGAGKLEEGETWTYTCLVEDVLPGTENTATVFACNEGGGACDDEDHDATDTASVTVTEDEDEPEPTDGPAATQSDTDTLVNGQAGQPADFTWLLIVGAAMLFVSIVATRSAKPAREPRR